MDFHNRHNIKIDDSFGIASDTHLCSKYADENALAEFYDILYSRGVKQVFHPGDVLDGTNVYKGQFNSLKVWGEDKQINYVIKNYPKKKNITTYFILGNHDARYLEHGGGDIGKAVAHGRDDMIYLGPYYTRIKDRGLKMDLLHPNGAPSYARSYKAQRWLEETPPQYHPDIALFGHWHQTGYMEVQGVHAILAGTFQQPNHYSIRYKLAGNIGGWHIEMKRDGKKIKRFAPELISYSRQLYSDY